MNGSFFVIHGDHPPDNPVVQTVFVKAFLFIFRKISYEKPFSLQ